MPRIDAFLQIGRQQGGSDIHFTVGLPPLVRMDGELVPIKYRVLDPDETDNLVGEILTEFHRQQFQEKGSVDLSYEAPDVGRFRINVCRHQRGMAAICRVIPDTVPDLEGLGLPAIVSQLGHMRSGLVLVTGPTGTGKSTTLAALIKRINQTRSVNIVTLEDPVEFVHASEKSLVVQRELGVHVSSFKEGLRSALRQDPDVILVGELRDADTISLALEASETGHLVLGTLHTRGAAQTIDRIIDAHPSENQSQIRHSLGDNLRCVLCQELVRLADGRGRRVAMEVLVVTLAVSQLIREGKTFQIPSAITTGRRVGMQLMDQSLLALVRAGEVDPDEAFLRANDKWGFAQYVTKPELLALIAAGPGQGGAPGLTGKAA
jgi:twitching motility protein PilT